MTHTETATAPSAREIRTAVRDLSGAQIAILTEIETTGSTARRLARPTRDALIRKGIVEYSATGGLTLTALGECAAAVFRPMPEETADAGVTEDAELADVLGDDFPCCAETAGQPEYWCDGCGNRETDCSCGNEPEMSTAEIMARVTGSVGATVIESRVAPDGTRTELSRHSWSRARTGASSTAAVLCDGGSRRCEGLVTDPAHVDAARAGDLHAFPYCGPCRVAAAGDAVMDEPVQGPERYGPGFYRLSGSLIGPLNVPHHTVTPGSLVALVSRRSADEWLVMSPSGALVRYTENELDRAGARHVDQEHA